MPEPFSATTKISFCGEEIEITGRAGDEHLSMNTWAPAGDDSYADAERMERLTAAEARALAAALLEGADHIDPAGAQAAHLEALARLLKPWRCCGHPAACGVPCQDSELADVLARAARVVGEAIEADQAAHAAADGPPPDGAPHPPEPRTAPHRTDDDTTGGDR